jgi:hypothetical protein
MSRHPLILFAAAVLVGCGPSHVPDPTITTNTRKTGVLSWEEIESSHADVNTAYDAIARLRPNWLSSHGVTSAQSARSTEYAIVVDGQRYGDVACCVRFRFHVGFDTTMSPRPGHASHPRGAVA